MIVGAGRGIFHYTRKGLKDADENGWKCGFDAVPALADSRETGRGKTNPLAVYGQTDVAQHRRFFRCLARCGKPIPWQTCHYTHFERA